VIPEFVLLAPGVNNAVPLALASLMALLLLQHCAMREIDVLFRPPSIAYLCCALTTLWLCIISNVILLFNDVEFRQR
jgi:hypothetical protein